MKKIIGRMNLGSSKVHHEESGMNDNQTVLGKLPTKRQTSFSEVDESHIEVQKAKLALAKLLRGHSEEVPRRFKRSASQALEMLESNRNFSYGSAEIGATDFMEPSIIEDLRMVRKIGNGSFGSVWKAENAKTGEPVAIKKVLGNSFSEQAKFLKEAEILQMSNHPNVLRFVGLFIKRGELAEDVSAHPETLDPSTFDNSVSIYLCTEYCKGGDLTAFLGSRIKSIPWQIRLRLALDIARGLKYLHSQKVVHRDIKGENVLLKPVKKLDWGDLEKQIQIKSFKRERRERINQTRGKKYRGLGLKVGDEDKPKSITQSVISKLPRIRSFKRIRPIKELTGSENSANEEFQRESSIQSPDPPPRKTKFTHPVGKNAAFNELEIDVEEVEQRIEAVVGNEQESEIQAKMTMTNATEVGDFDFMSTASSDYDSDDTGFVVDQDKRLKSLLNSRAILADVGLARFFKASTAGKKPEDVHKVMNSERMTIRGTPWTMAPELIMNKLHYTTSSDVYSLGIVFLEISLRVTPEPTFLPRKDDMTPNFEEIDKMPVDPVRTEDNEEEQQDSLIYNDACPPEFRLLSMRCCHIDPLQRPTARDIVKELEEIVRKLRKVNNTSFFSDQNSKF